MNIFYTILNLNRIYKKFILIFIDSLVLGFSFFITYCIFFSDYTLTNNFQNFNIEITNLNLDLKFIILCVILYSNMISLIYFNFYDTIFRYRGFRTILNLFLRLLINSIILMIISYLIFFIFFNILDINFYFLILYFFISFLLFFLSLLSLEYIIIQTIISNLYKKGKKENILIYGAGSAGFLFSQQLTEYNILGFIDDDIQKIGNKINNFNIGSLKDYENLIKNKLISSILILIPSLKYKQRKEIVKKLLNYKIPFKFLNSADNLIKNNLVQSEFQNISPNELIDRIVNWNIDKIGLEFLNSNVLVTGAGGSIGGDLSKKLSRLDINNLILLDINEYNLFEIKSFLSKDNNTNISNKIKIEFVLGSTLDKELISKILNKYSITHIIHAAAFKHVELCELNKNQCLLNNFVSTINLAQLSLEYKVKKFLLISTDKSINPTTIMGLSKKISEEYIQLLSNEVTNSTIFFGVRFGNVIGSRGSVIPIFQKQINEKKPITLTHPDMKRYLMSIDDASNLILESFTIARTGFIYILNMGEPIKIIDIITKMVNYAGLSIKNDENPAGDISIKIIGQKKGEKLNEELFNSLDYKKTTNKDIFYENNSKKFKVNSSEMRDQILNLIKNEKYEELLKGVNFYY